MLCLYILFLFAPIWILAHAPAGNAAEKLSSASTPLKMVSDLYAPYLKDPHAESQESPPNELDAILKQASKNLSLAIHKNDDCERRAKGPCNIDFDIVIDGQDWDLSDLSFEEKELPNEKYVVDANFLNGTRSKVSYLFIRERNRWKIDDVIATRYKADGQVDFVFPLKQKLNRLWKVK